MGDSILISKYRMACDIFQTIKRHFFGKAKNRVNGYLGSDSGNIGIIAAVSATVLLIGASAAIDFANLHRHKTVLQDGADAAVLAAARSVYFDRKSEVRAKQVAKTVLITNGIYPNSYKCEAVKIFDRSVSMACTGEVKTTFSKLVGMETLSFHVSSEASVGIFPKVEVTLVYDISDSMLQDNRIQTLERALNEFLRADVFTNVRYDARFSLIPFANSVAFSDIYAKWLDPVVGYSISPTFNRCFSPEATYPNILFDGSPRLLAMPDRLSNKNQPYCPAGQMSAKFFMNRRVQASQLISRIPTSNGTGSNEGLMWGYRSLHPDMAGILDRNRQFPRSFDEDHKKILIFLTDGKPKNKPWVGKIANQQQNFQESADRFVSVCNHIKSNDENIDMYMIGFGSLSRGVTDLSSLLEKCVMGTGKMILADNKSLRDELLNIVSINHDIALTR